VAQAGRGVSHSWRTPGTRFGYHTQTFGFLVGETLRRAAGRPISALLRDHLTGPLGMADDIHFGVPAEQLPRVARQVAPEGFRPCRRSPAQPWNEPSRQGSPRTRISPAGALSRQAGDQAGQGWALTGLGECHPHLGNYDLARGYARQALDVTRRPTALIIRKLALLTISRGADGEPWEVDLSGVCCPVASWRGGDDRCAPPAHGMRLAEDLPGARLVQR
jgi:CubicO group peptidase (beta-lactamase class C family)